MSAERPLFMIPGPVEVDPSVIAAMQVSAIDHHDPAYYATLDRAAERLRSILGTAGRCLILPGSGRLGLESAIATLTRPGDRTLHMVNGFFGSFPLEMARRSGCEATALQLPWERPVDPAVLEQALSEQQYRVVTVAHCETSTGVVNPVAELGRICRRHGALLMVDGIASVGAIPLAMDEMEIDVCITASQKGLGAIMGLAVAGLGSRAVAALDEAAGRGPAQSLSLDMGRWEAFFRAPKSRPYPVVPSPHLVLALSAALDVIDAEGLGPRFARHAAMASATRTAVLGLGLQLYPDAGVSAALTVVRVPEGLDGGEIHAAMKERHGVLVGGGQAPLTGRIIRIAHMAGQAHPKPLARTVEALGNVLSALGHRCDPAQAAAAFR